MALVPFSNQAPVPAPGEDETDPDWSGDDQTGGKMSFLEHLDELRKRIIWSLTALIVGTVAAFTYHNEIFDFVMRPMQALLPKGGTLIYTDPTEAFMLHIKLAHIAGLILATPVVFTQLWLFIAPGLYAKEKRMAIPFVAMSSVLFVAGAAFSHYVVFPITWQFFVGFTNDILTFMPRVEPAFAIYMRLILALGITFQLPTVVLFLARMGLITPRFMITNFKYAVMLIVIAAAVLSPDGGGVGLVAMGAPVIVLYILSIGLAWIFGKKKPAEDAEPA
jgi:sec-independent protein translocase protein TatC